MNNAVLEVVVSFVVVAAVVVLFSFFFVSHHILLLNFDFGFLCLFCASGSFSHIERLFSFFGWSRVVHASLLWVVGFWVTIAVNTFKTGQSPLRSECMYWMLAAKNLKLPTKLFSISCIDVIPHARHHLIDF